MSRNIRKQYPRTPDRVSKRRGSDSSSLQGLSDDDGYSGVDDVSDSDDEDEDHVFAAEEEQIISENVKQHRSGPLRPHDDTGEEADEEEDDDEEDDDDDDEGGESWNGILSEVEDAITSEDADINYLFDQDGVNAERHVRFTGVPDSDSDSTTTDTEELDGMFPDIFVEQGALDPAFRREIEYDDESSNSGSFWDLHSSQELLGAESDEDVGGVAIGDDTPTATPMASQAPTEASTPIPLSDIQELDGYETDGDTTEEDVPEPPPRKKQVRRSQSTDVTSDSDTERPARLRRGTPRVGKFNLDGSDSKPIAVVNPLTKKMMIFTPQKLRRLDLSPESFNLPFFSPAGVQSSPILNDPGALMMSAMLTSNTFGDFMNTQAIGPTEAFFPFNHDGLLGEDTDETGGDDDEEDEEERNLKLEDFISFDVDSSDGGGEDTDVVWDAQDNVDLAATPTRPRTSGSARSATSDGAAMELHPLLSHFNNNSDAVGAFRRNQVNKQLILSDKASHESLAFSGPYYHGTLRGIKSGSMEAVTAPITPVRRKKRNSVVSFNVPSDLNSSPSQNVSQKRKASGIYGDNIHKRHRSISDMEVLHI